MEKEIKHTPLPYKRQGYHVVRTIGGENSNIVAMTYGLSQAEAEANAEFIVRACNSHYELLAKAHKLVRHIEDRLKADDKKDVEFTSWLQSELSLAKSAINKAEGK